MANDPELMLHAPIHYNAIKNQINAIKVEEGDAGQNKLHLGTTEPNTKEETL